MTEHKPKISGNKKEEVKEIQQLFREYPIVGVVNLENLPAMQYMKMKYMLRDKVVFKMSKKRVIKKALEGVQLPGIDQLKEKITGMPVLLFTKDNPFELYKTIDRNKSNAAARPGQIAPRDIVIPAGQTNFPAGPMIGEFGMLGIKTEVKEGKIGIREDKLIVKEGEVINDKIAGLLPKLGIEPMEIGLNLLFTYEKGEILPKSVLSIDEKKYISMITQTYFEGLNLAVKIGYMTKESVELMIKKLQLEAMAVANKANVDFTKPVEAKEQRYEPKIEERKEKI